MVRHLRKQLRDHAMPSHAVEAWQRLRSLHWVIDRLHWTYNRGCRIRDSPWFVDGVAPADHATLDGVDTEAAEQLFHIANRWQSILSNTAPVHQELFLLLFANARNQRHSCDAAIAKYKARRRQTQYHHLLRLASVTIGISAE